MIMIDHDKAVLLCYLSTKCVIGSLKRVLELIRMKEKEGRKFKFLLIYRNTIIQLIKNQVLQNVVCRIIVK